MAFLLIWAAPACERQEGKVDRDGDKQTFGQQSLQTSTNSQKADSFLYERFLCVASSLLGLARRVCMNHIYDRIFGYSPVIINTMYTPYLYTVLANLLIT